MPSFHFPVGGVGARGVLVWVLEMRHVVDVVVVPTRAGLCHPEDDCSAVVFNIFKQRPHTQVFGVTKNNFVVSSSPHDTGSLRPPGDASPEVD